MTPTDRLVLARPSAVILRAGAVARAARALTGRPSDGLLDRDHPPAVQVEPHLVDLPPTPEELVVDAEGRTGVVLLLPAGEVGALQDRPDDRAVAVLGQNPLLLRRLHILDERVG